MAKRKKPKASLATEIKQPKKDQSAISYDVVMPTAQESLMILEQLRQQTDLNMPASGFGVGDMASYAALGPQDKAVAILAAENRNRKILGGQEYLYDVMPIAEIRSRLAFTDSELEKLGKEHPETHLAEMTREQRLSWVRAANVASREVGMDDIRTLAAHPDVSEALNDFGAALAKEGNEIYKGETGRPSYEQEELAVMAAVDALQSGVREEKLAAHLQKQSKDNVNAHGIPPTPEHGLNALTTLAAAIHRGAARTQ